MPKKLLNITAVILAGGQGSRLGGLDKGIVELNHIPLVQHLINRLQPQVNKIMISANRNLNWYTEFGYKVFEDDVKDFAGPLAGILKALQQNKSEWLLTVAADCPFIPDDLVQRLFLSHKGNKVIMAHDGKQLQPTIALIHNSLEPSLKKFLQQGERKTRDWMQQQEHIIVDFSDQINAFMNINTQAELQFAEKHFSTLMP